ncbi:5'-AMP-activated serine/threonine-protein kinase catalytic subunit alpha-like isoform X1 [Rhagoletis pomonella]|uniref:5'-AMP-activated serine/threonine-protein kinase catalytic subunit alpha-like isoform X1 n=1 Tax=Rhagoletis pomonella TaxID=28610 RepID=UPI001782C922|nr:5'-AMP-activated serine/threonine-protein kinase catalytic subunit alpha-like isoform X1 [Rhagoletis pomonella]
MLKTRAEKAREYRRRLRGNKPKPPPKTSTERVREFRARRKALLNEQDSDSATDNNASTVQNSENVCNNFSVDEFDLQENASIGFNNENYHSHIMNHNSGNSTMDLKLEFSVSPTHDNAFTVQNSENDRDNFTVDELDVQENASMGHNNETNNCNCPADVKLEFLDCPTHDNASTVQNGKNVCNNFPADELGVQENASIGNNNENDHCNFPADVKQEFLDAPNHDNASTVKNSENGSDNLPVDELDVQENGSIRPNNENDHCNFPADVKLEFQDL